MNRESTMSLPTRLAALALACAALAAGLATAGRAEAEVPPEQAMAAAQAGADWFRAEQIQTGALPGDWGMTALAAAGTNSADVRVSVADPSAQDFYVDDWAANGPGFAATDPERVVLAGSAGGIQTSRVSTTWNMVAQIAGFWDGQQIGSTGLLNDDIFGVLALDRVDFPDTLLTKVADHIRTKQLPDGGWSWSNSPSATSDTDMTGSVVAALCATGADPATDPDIQEAFGYLHTVQDDATGGFAAPPWTGVNTDSTGWVASGLIQCGIDPQAAEWTTTSGKTPFDFLVSMQMPDGRFCWQETTTCQGSAAFATWDAVRPLAGAAFSADVPARENAGDPAVRPAPAVADGTDVPVALVIDYGNGEAGMCKVRIGSGADLGETLAAAEANADPENCVAEHQVSSTPGGQSVEQLNGVTPDARSEWVVSVDGAPAAARTSEPIGFGDVVLLRLAGKADGPIDPPPVDPGPSTRPDQIVEAAGLAKAGLRSSARRARVRRGAIKPLVTCPRGLGAEGCRGTVTIRYRWKGRVRTGGQVPFAIASGDAARVRLVVKRRLRRLAARSGGHRITIVAATRSPEGAMVLTRSKRVLTVLR